MSAEVHKILKVGLNERTYPIYIGHDLGSMIYKSFLEHKDQGKQVVALIDEGLKKEAPLFAEDLLSSVSTLQLPSGESTKSVLFLSRIWDFLANEGVDRSGVLFALGGGVTGDLSGFAAAIFAVIFTSPSSGIFTSSTASAGRVAAIAWTHVLSRSVYWLMYALNLPSLRTFSYVMSVICIVMLFLHALQH